MIQLKDLKIEQYDLYVGLLTEQQKDSLLIQQYAPDCYFNPIQDEKGRWVISEEEVLQYKKATYAFIKSAPLKEHEAKKEEPIKIVKG